jgi:phage gp29-like protein
MVGHLLDGLARGYSVVELVWDTTATPWTPRYEWRDPTFFQLDRVTGQQIRLRDGSADGQELPPHKFMIHVPDLITGLPIAGGLAMLGVWAFMFKSFSLQDWAAFGEFYGMPIRIGRYDQAHSPEDRAILRQAVAMIGRQAAAILPRGMDLEFIDAAKGAVGPDVFKQLAEYWDAQVSKVILGQTMTADDGSSLAQAKVHNEVRLDILEADAGDVSETLQRDLVAPFIDLNYGRPNHGRYPVIRLLVPDMDDTQQWVGMVTALVDRGMKVGMSTVRDKLGLPDPDADEELLHPPGAASAPAIPPDRATARATAREATTDPDPLVEALRDELLDGWEPVMAPMVDPLVEALRDASSFEEALALLPQLADRMDLTAFTDHLATATAAGRAVGVLESEDSQDGGGGDG